MYMDYIEIGRRIAHVRRARRMTQVEVEDEAGLSRKYLSNIEHGRSIPSIDVLMQIANALHTTPNVLLLGASVSDREWEEEETDDAVLADFHRLPSGKREVAKEFLSWLNETKNVV